MNDKVTVFLPANHALRNKHHLPPEQGGYYRTEEDYNRELFTKEPAMYYPGEPVQPTTAPLLPKSFEELLNEPSPF